MQVSYIFIQNAFCILNAKKKKSKISVSLTFGMNTKKSVAVEQNNINTDMMMKDASCWSLRTKEIAAPATHMSTTLYTLMPTYLESFNAGMLTCRVSQARKAPKT